MVPILLVCFAKEFQSECYWFLKPIGSMAVYTSVIKQLCTDQLQNNYY